MKITNYNGLHVETLICCNYALSSIITKLAFVIYAFFGQIRK